MGAVDDIRHMKDLILELSNMSLVPGIGILINVVWVEPLIHENSLFHHLVDILAITLEWNSPGKLFCAAI